MYKELIKSIVLFLLVITSMVLTLQLWSYEPEFSEIDTSIKSIASGGQGEQVSFKRAVRAYQTVWVTNDGTRGTNDSSAVVSMREALNGARVTNIHVRNDVVTFNPTFDGNNQEFLIIDYPSDVPMKTLLQVLGLTSQVTITDEQFSRIIIDLNSENVEFYLVNNTYDTITTVSINYPSEDLKSVIDAHQDKFVSYSGMITNQITSSNWSAIYAPTTPKAMEEEIFVGSLISNDLMNQILFLSSNYEKEETDEKIIYTSQSNEMSEYVKDSNSYVYINLDQSEVSSDNAHQMIRRSFDFLNSHRALSKESSFFEFVPEQSKSVFRQTLNGLFVFSDEIEATIQVKYGENKLYEYQRSQIRPNVNVGREEKSLDTLENVRYKISVNPNLDLEKVTKVMIGYRLTNSDAQSELDLIRYSPYWYVKYDGEWMRYEDGELL